MITPKTKLEKLGLITPNYYKPLKKFGLETIENLLFYFPFRYDDFSRTTLPSPEFLGKNITVEGKIIKAKKVPIYRRRMTIIEASIEVSNEPSLKFKAIWFNQSFLFNSLTEGNSIRLAGKLEIKGKTFQMTNPAFERSARETTNTGRLIPVYPETKGITSKWIRWQMKNFLPLASQLEETLPRKIYSKFNLFSLERALRQIHFPSSWEHLQIAQKTFAFQEMFLLQLKALLIKKDWQEKKSLATKINREDIEKFKKQLPFQLTGAQEKASREILNDLQKNTPMNRLLNGDVGSGKTIVAALAALPILQSDNQVAIMAPTEVLARQHFESFCQIFKNHDFNIGLLTKSYKMTCQEKDNKNRNEFLSEIKKGKINLVIGTHALIQKDVSFQKLALVIIDEQHRFGVAQRANLQEESMEINDGSASTIPHLLTMTATPIPRSLSIALSGMLDISLLDEFPKNRKPIITKIITLTQRSATYNFIRQEIQKGRQVFIILPLVEDSKALSELKSAKTEYVRLSQKVFPEYQLGLLHGKIKSNEKEKIMEDFQNKKYDILVATSVVEVGIDIPNASVIVIENAERFGLTQLHQFRGRVGRGEHQSYCLLFSSSTSQISMERLKVIAKTNDGFQISEHDLKLRGPGQFFGTSQSGLPDVSMENITNMKLVKLSQEEAKKLLEADPDLKKHPEIKKALERFQESLHLE